MPFSYKKRIYLPNKKDLQGVAKTFEVLFAIADQWGLKILNPLAVKFTATAVSLKLKKASNFTAALAFKALGKALSYSRRGVKITPSIYVLPDF